MNNSLPKKSCVRTTEGNPMSRTLSAAFLLFFVNISIAYAGWNCSCGRYAETKYCTYCGAKEPLVKQKPSYVHSSESEWYNGKRVKMTPIHLGFLGPDLVLPPGESYSVCGLCTDPFAAIVVNTYGIEAGALFASTHKSMYGLQIGGVATSAKELIGVQIGAFNCTETAYGLQIGVFNRAETLHGVQIGAVNVVRNSSVPFMPVINICF